MASRAMLRILGQLRKKANFESCGFSDFEIPGKFAVHFPFIMPCTTDELTASIKESTRLYRESWVLPLIDALIAYENGEVSLNDVVRTHL